MLIPRLISGVLLAALAVGVVYGDSFLAPWYPCLFVAAAVFAGLAARELVALLPELSRPPLLLAVGGVVATVAANWVAPNAGRYATWVPVLFTFVAVLIAAFLWEMYRYREPGHAAARIANTGFVVAYLGILPSFLVQLRRLGPDSGTWIALTIFVPKLGDVSAYFTGRFFGKHKMTPLLSPKKTREGFAGGLLGSVLTAFLPALWIPYRGTDFAFYFGFGLTVGIAGVLGDLAESLLKRDAGTKDAARSIPGFGGVLDVIDSVLFAAPVAYLWFVL
ncbi:MAG TPA: phosphatidate cytidylyltransferase [Fimbriiglobus sp.]|jgi:phosphatidate cytidylyltransferase